MATNREGTRKLLEGQVRSLGRVLHGSGPGFGFFLQVFEVESPWQAIAFSTDITRDDLCRRLRLAADRIEADGVHALAGPADAF